MMSNRRIALHFDTTGYKGSLEKQAVVRIHAVSFGIDCKPEEYEQAFMPSCSIPKSESNTHGYTKQALKKMHAPLFSKELAAKFVEFVGDSDAYGHQPWTTRIVNNALRNVGVEPLPKLHYTYTLYKELHPEKRALCKNGQHPLSMITQDYKVSDDITGAYRVAEVMLQMEADLKAREVNSAASVSKDEKQTAETLASLSMFKAKVKPVEPEIAFSECLGLYGMKIA